MPWTSLELKPNSPGLISNPLKSFRSFTYSPNLDAGFALPYHILNYMDLNHIGDLFLKQLSQKENLCR